MATNNTLFPEIRTAEQIARYKAIFAILEGYRQGTVSMKEVLTIPKEEIQEARAWVTSVSLALLVADIPEIGDELDG